MSRSRASSSPASGLNPCSTPSPASPPPAGTAASPASRPAPEAHGVRIAYAEPARFGVDRFLGLIGAHAIQAGPKLIIDAGTAITYDLLLADGSHLGGLILPGIGIMRDSLLAGTQIPRYEPAEADQAWATDTAEAVAAASIQAPAALAERLYHRLSDHTGQTPTLIITGGDAERLLPATHTDAIHHPELVLLGLSRFA